MISYSLNYLLQNCMYIELWLMYNVSEKLQSNNSKYETVLSIRNRSNSS